MVSRRAMTNPEAIGANSIDVEDPKGREKESEQPTAPLKEPGDKPDCILRWCRFISLVDVVVLLAAGAACICTMATCRDIPALVLRGTSVAFLLLLIAEQATRTSSSCSCICLRQIFPMLEYWVGRGLLHVFVAVQMEGTSAENIDEATKNFLDATSVALLILGVFFIAGAFLCFGPLERRQQRLASRKEEVMRELSELERRKKALESEAGL
mmetsp:Transcript_26282/g.60938  ORF Transcript_26282/g.60938 Transcript_26282/m.60938 type:complete len:212 (+) Transcript_26282:28-663(+)